MNHEANTTSSLVLSENEPFLKKKKEKQSTKIENQIRTLPSVEEKENQTIFQNFLHEGRKVSTFRKKTSKFKLNFILPKI